MKQGRLRNNLFKIITQTSVELYIEYFLENNSIPDTILNRVKSENKNFIDKINEVLGTEYTYDELLQEYKSDYLEECIYSSATVLYCSKAFSQVFETISAPKEEAKIPEGIKVGRNEPCPCGSGKKYKNCCGK